MIKKERIAEILKGYKKTPAVATVCSHTSLQIFHGAKSQGLKTIGICVRGREKIYDAFPLSRPDEFVFVDSYSDIPASELVSRSAILVPHGSLVEYLGRKIGDFDAPILGNRLSLEWEGSREKMHSWLTDSGLNTPRTYANPDDIDRPCIVKTDGASGGQGYEIVHSGAEYRNKFGERKLFVQEFLSGVRAYPHYFYSPISKSGYSAGEGTIELLGVDRRIESNADEIARAAYADKSAKMSFTVVGNEPMVLRESLLPKYLEMGKNVAESSSRLFGGIPGPFCIETIITGSMDIYAFEISARIVAGTNIAPLHSAYSPYISEAPLSMGMRIAMEIKSAVKKKALAKICY
jgi:5-formaminoimidazole-4-carboxamide-1-(beta)-D-ribofuranosyl 5'-monophosphate synthetase